MEGLAISSYGVNNLGPVIQAPPSESIFLFRGTSLGVIPAAVKIKEVLIEMENDTETVVRAISMQHFIQQFKRINLEGRVRVFRRSLPISFHFYLEHAACIN